MKEKILNKLKRIKFNKKIIRNLVIILSIIIVIVVAFFVAISNPRVKFLLSVTRFATETLNDKSYIGYDVDVMGVCRDYFNADIEYSGDVLCNDIYGFGYSAGAKINGQRSFEQRKLSCNADSKVLFINVGLCQVYVVDDTIYMILPDFDNLAYSFTVNSDLFMKAPEFTANLDLEWFEENASNILELTRQISISETGETIEDEDGTLSKEYRVIIPKGTGEFIWQLLGINMPDHDISVDMYITNSAKIRRIEMDLGTMIENSTLVVDGTNMGTCIFTKQLPDNEVLKITFTRNANYHYTNYMDMTLEYFTRDNSVLWGTGYMTWEEDSGGYNIEVNKLTLYKDKTLQGKMHFVGYVKPSKINYDVSKDAKVPLESIKNLKWEEIRNDMEGFVEDVKRDVMERL